MMKRFVSGTLLAAAAIPLLFASAIAQDEVVKLPPPDKKGGKPLMQCLTERKSERSFSDRQLEPQVLSNLFYAAYGINREDGGRTAPSARNAQDMLVYAAMPSGLYLYNPADNTLELKLNKDIREKCGMQSDMHKKAALVLIYVSDTSKLKTSDKDVKEFYSANHTGYISQNVYLFCASEGLNTVVCAMIDKDALSKLMGLPENCMIQLIQPLGYPVK